MKLPGSGHFGGQEQKQLSSLGTKLRFHKKFCKKCHCIDHHYGRHVRWLGTKNKATFQCVGC